MAVIGGGNLSVFFTADETTGLIGSTKLATFTKKVKTSVSRTNFTLDQNEDSPELTDFFDKYAPVQQATSDSGEYEDGVKFNSATANSQTLLQIVYGGKLADSGSSNTTKRKVVLMLCKLAQDTGSFDMESGKYTKPKVSGEVVNNDALVTVGTLCFDTTALIAASIATVTIPVDTGYKEVWIGCTK
jgi:hypothetical protein